MPTHALVNNGNADIIVAVYQHKIVLTDAQIKALPTTPIEIFSALGENKAVNIFAAVIRCDFSAGAYTNVDASYVDLSLQPANLPMLVKDPASSINLIPFETADIKNYLISGQFTVNGGYNLALPFSEGIFNNYPVSLWCTNEAGNFTGGNAANTLSVTVLYSIVDL
jgi:hypothetical protein